MDTRKIEEYIFSALMLIAVLIVIGILNAILGSLLLGIGATILAAAIALPIVFYLNLYLRRKSRFALAVRFFLDVLWGIPSVVYGAFGFTLMIFFGLGG